MAVGVKYQTLVDRRATGSELVRSDFFTIPNVVGPTYRTVELPLNVITAPSVTDPIYVRTVHPITHVPLGPVFTMVVDPVAPLAGEFQIRGSGTDNFTFRFGSLLFNQLDQGSTVEIIYTGRGSLIFAADVNDPRDELLDARGGFPSVGDRITSIVAANPTFRVDYVSGTPSGSYTGSSTVIDLPFSYTLGTARLLTFVDGLIGTRGASFDYTETSTTQITYTNPITVGSNISVIVLPF